MVDVFEEVEERLRSDQYSGLARKYLPWVGGLCALALAVALGIWGYGQYRQHAAEKASEAYAQGVEALGKGDSAMAFLHFAAAAKAGAPVYRSLALMQQAGIKITTGDTPGAVKLLDEAAQAAPDQVLADAARLKAAYAVLDTGTYADVEARLKPLSDAKRPYHALAREGLAMLKLRDGRLAEARGDFLVLTTTLDAPDDMRARAHVAMTLIDDGSAAGIGAMVKAALTLPTPPVAAPGAALSAQQTPEAGAAQ